MPGPFDITDEELATALGMPPPLPPLDSLGAMPVTLPTEEELAQAFGPQPPPVVAPAAAPQPPIDQEMERELGTPPTTATEADFERDVGIASPRPEISDDDLGRELFGDLPNIGIGVGGASTPTLSTDLAPWEQRFTGDLAETELERPDVTKALAADVGPAPVPEIVEGMTEDEQRQFYMDMGDRAFAMEQQRLADERAAAAQAFRDREAAAIEATRQEKMAMADAADAKARADLIAMQEEMEAAASEKVDPNQFWETRSTGQKVMAALAVLFHGFNAPYHGGRNPALEHFERLVKQNIDAQIANLKAGRARRKDRLSVIDRVFDRTGNVRLAARAEYVARMNDLKQKTLQVAEQWDPRSTRAMQAAQTARKIDGQIAQHLAEARKDAHQMRREQASDELKRRNIESQIAKRDAETAKLRGELGGPGRRVGRPRSVAAGSPTDWETYLGIRDASRGAGKDTMERLVPLDWGEKKFIIANTDKDAEILKDAKEGAQTFGRLSGELAHLIDEHGNEVNTRRYKTVIASQMETLYGNLLFAVKNMEKGGALDKGLVEQVEKIVGDPSVFRLNPGAAAEKLRTAQRVVMANWETRVGTRAARGDWSGWNPRSRIDYGAADVGLTMSEAVSKLTKGATPELRADAVSDIVTKHGGLMLDEERDAYTETTVADAARAGAWSDQDRDQGIELLEKQLEKEKDPAVRAEIKRGITSLKRSKTRAKVTERNIPETTDLDEARKAGERARKIQREAERAEGVILEGDPDLGALGY